MFTPLPAEPDSNALELEILERWEREGTFEQLRERNRGGPKWSFIDGPVTANKSLAVHTAWGRTLKDVFQRYKALRGFDQRYQNGFDCQGLWIEVGVERQLGLNSKREIEEFGLEEFAAAAATSSSGRREELTRGCKRLGQWMDWGNDYFTFSDTNIEYIWRFLKIVHERGWLYLGHRSTEWCPRCGTSLSQHELTQSGVYQEKPTRRSSSASRCSTAPGESVVVWTTTPWTLPANVAAAVNPEAEYGLRENGEWVAVARYPDEQFERARRGARSSSACATAGRSTTSRRARPSSTASSPWDEVSLEEGTGIVHIATGLRRRGLRARPRRSACRCSRRSTRPAASTTTTAGCTASRPPRRPTRSSATSRERGFLVEAGLYEHRYPHCWRCDTPLIFRISDDWFIGVDERPRAAARGERDRRVGAGVHGQAHGRLAAQHGRLEHLAPPLLRPAAAVLSVRVRAPERDRVEGGARGARGRGLRAARGAAPAVDRPRPDPLRGVRRAGRARRRGRRRLARRRHRPVLDARLAEPGVGRRRLRDRRRARASRRADLPDHAYWEEWFPADWVSEMREQIRLWFYSQLFMSVVLVGRAPFKRVLGYEKMLDEHGPRDARLVGEHDRRRGRVRAHGRRRDALAVLRAAARPQPALRLRARRTRSSGSCSRSGTRSSSSSTTRTSRASTPTLADLDGRPAGRAAARPLARRAHARSSCTRRPRRTRRR